ncbi:MAG: 3,4-dihydroxy-2-butanone-4-phosphate synthase [Flavobacteriaceae bacterium]|nr:3,4-dihydroxy-2-butanone-4-phosphate synthase [Flavobacteriaceae bacterium]
MISTKPDTIQLNTIKEAISDIKKGKIVIVVDDEDRENEGDFIAAAEKVTPQLINFMITQGRGLICAPITEGRCKELDLDLMVGYNTDPLGTAFTVSVDYNGEGVTTGISVNDRARTVLALTESSTKPHELSRPGHIFPLKARDGGVLRRTGHTEAAIDLARLAGFQPAGVIVEIMNEDGSMARLPQLLEVAKKFNLKIISIEDLVAYRMQHDSLIEKIEDFNLKTRFGEFRLRAYKQTTNDQVHLALTKGDWEEDEPVLVRVNSTLINNDIIRLLTNKPDDSFSRMFKLINSEGRGAIVFINQENQSFNLVKRLDLIKELQEENLTAVPQIKLDDKDFGIGAQILHDLSINKLRLITNGKYIKKRVGIIGYGLEIVENVAY